MGNDARELIERVEELPPLPAVAARVMAMADDDRSSALDMAQVLSSDQALTAKLIRISNSAYYGFARKVSTVREAVVVLGMKQVRQLAVGASLMQSFGGRFDNGVFDIDLFWGHSVAVAIAAETIAKKTRAARPEDAFTAGILHDIGRLVLRMQMPAEFREAVLIAREGEVPLRVAETEMTGYRHDEIGRALGEKWKFPAHLVDAVAHHHDEKASPEADGLEGVVAQANALVLHYGLYSGYDVEGGELAPISPELDRYETMCGGIEHVLDRSFAFIESASGTPERWFAGAA